MLEASPGVRRLSTLPAAAGLTHSGAWTCGPMTCGRWAARCGHVRPHPPPRHACARDRAVASASWPGACGWIGCLVRFHAPGACRRGRASAPSRASRTGCLLQASSPAQRRWPLRSAPGLLCASGRIVAIGCRLSPAARANMLPSGRAEHEREHPARPGVPVLPASRGAKTRAVHVTAPRAFRRCRPIPPPSAAQLGRCAQASPPSLGGPRASSGAGRLRASLPPRRTARAPPARAAAHSAHAVASLHLLRSGVEG